VLSSSHDDLQELSHLREESVASHDVADDLVWITQILVLLADPIQPPLEECQVSGVDLVHSGKLSRYRWLSQNDQQVQPVHVRVGGQDLELVHLVSSL